MGKLILFHRLVLRPLLKDRVRTALLVTAVAVGVGVVLAIELAGNAAAGSFHASMETLVGEDEWEITATGGIAPELLRDLAELPYELQLKPRLEAFAHLPDQHRSVLFLGVDLLTDTLGGSPVSNDDAKGVSIFERDDAIWVGAGLPQKVGDRVRFVINDREFMGAVQGRLGKGSGDVVVMDLGPASRVIGNDGRLDRILIKTPAKQTGIDWERVLRRAVPHSVTLAKAGSRTDENRRMMRAFRWNLRVLSYIALVVGSFLIYNAISVSVVRRREEIGILRALGTARSTVLFAFLGEAAFLGLAGSVAGIALGRLLAGGAVGAVGATVESLYVSSAPGPIQLSSTVVLFGLAMGVGVALISALFPAFEASGVSPVEAMNKGRREHQVRTSHFRAMLMAVLLVAGAWFAARQPAIDGRPLLGYLAAVLAIATSALIIPSFVTLVSRVLSRVLRHVAGVEAAMAARNVAGSLRRSSVLVAALSTAVAMMAAVGIMVGSFRTTVVLWMDDRLGADLYLRPAGSAGADRHPVMAAKVAREIEKLPEIAAVDWFRAYEISYGGLPATLASSHSRIAGQHGRRPFLSGADPKHVLARLADCRECVVVSEPFADKHRVKQDDWLSLPIGGHHAKLRVLDVYFDYSSERGYILMDRASMLRFLPDPSPSNLAVYLKPGIDLKEGRRAVANAIAGHRVLVFTNRRLREEAIRIFDRTFAITYALEGIAIVVAVLGVAGALLTMVVDRRREYGLLRFLGASQGQIRRLILFEAGILGLLSNAAGLGLGYALSLLLIFVINKQSFGWTIQFHWPVAMLLSAISLVYFATVAAGLYPARVAARLNPIKVIHED